VSRGVAAAEDEEEEAAAAAAMGGGAMAGLGDTVYVRPSCESSSSDLLWW
jgi:hypothetical protein